MGDNMINKDGEHLKKKELQIKAVQAWTKAGCIGTLEAATGFGKFFASFLAISTTVDPGDTRPILVLAEVTNREQTMWSDMEKYRRIYGEDLADMHTFEFACYQSAWKWSGRNYKMVISDEVHDSCSLKYSMFYKNNTYDKLLGLSATVDSAALIDPSNPFSKTKGELLKEIAPICYTYTAEEGRNEGVLPPLNVYVINHKIDTVNKTVQGGSKSKGIFMQTEKAALEYVDKMLQTSYGIQNRSRREVLINIWIRKRASLLYSLPSKIEEAKKVVSLFQDYKNRFIVFGNHLKTLHTILPGKVVASKNEEGKAQSLRENTHIIESFNKGFIDSIGSFKKLKQGENLVDLDAAIITSYYSKKKDLVQQLGRLRFRDGFIGTAIIFKTVGSREEEWFFKMTEDMDRTKFLYFDGVGQFEKFVKDRKGEITFPTYVQGSTTPTQTPSITPSPEDINLNDY